MPDDTDVKHTLTHDQNFKNLILDYPRQSLEFFAAEESGEMTPEVRITPVRQEQMKDRLGDHFHEKPSRANSQFTGPPGTAFTFRRCSKQTGWCRPSYFCTPGVMRPHSLWAEIIRPICSSDILSAISHGFRRKIIWRATTSLHG